jgi:hypothetical protein
MGLCTKTLDNKVVLACRFAAFSCHKYVCKEPTRVAVVGPNFSRTSTDPFHPWMGAQCPQFQPRKGE